VLVGAIGVWLGRPLAAPFVGLMFTIAILFIVWEAAKAIFTRALDGVEPDVLEKIRDTAQHIHGVKDVAEVRARWVGHRLNAEVNIAVDSNLSVAEAHQIARATHNALENALPFLSRAVIHVDPESAVGETHHVSR
jgi:divalent metal cation (Fe/Co/Zn/Cd) transporter